LNDPLGEAIDLTGAEYNLMLAFAERPNRVLSRDAIADLTRKEDWEAFDRSIDTLVSRLRKKLAPHTDASQLIQTVRGEGYVLAADVKWSGGR
jgi:DNA-binding response OmpR family regulator